MRLLRLSPAAQRRLLYWVIFTLSSATALSAQAGLPPAETVPRQPRLFQIAPGAFRRFTVDSSVCKYAEVLLESSAPRIDVAVLSADGSQLKAVTSEYPGWLALSFPTAANGLYQVVVRSSSTELDAKGASVHLSFVCSAGSGAKSLVEAEGLFARAQSLSHSLRAEDLRQAISDDERARVAWMKAADLEGEILALAGEARVQLGLSQYSRALVTLTRARSILAAPSFWNAWLTNLQAQVYLDRWDSENAKSKSMEALKLSVSMEDEWLTADALASRGESEYLTHQSSAKTDIEEALRIAEQIQAVGAIARSLRCDAWIEKDESHLTHASAMMEGAREYFHRQGEVRSELQALSTLANIANASGDPYSSLLRHTRLAELFRQSGSTSHYAILLENVGTDYHSLNRLADAIVYFRKALEAYKSVGHRSGEALALSELCAAEMESNRVREALLDCSAEGVIVKQFHDPKRTAIATWDLGRVQLALGRTATAIDSFQRAEAISETVHDTRFAAQALLDLGGAEASLGRWQEAEEVYAKALGLSRIAENVSLQVEARYQIARIEVQRGNTVDAMRNLDDALAMINPLRRSVRNAGLQAAYFAQVRKCHDLYVQALMNEHDGSQSPRSEDAAARALEMNEAGIALTLLDAIAARDVDQDSPNRLRVANASSDLHQAVERAYDQRLRLMIEGARGAELNANATSLRQAIDSLERAEDAEADLSSSSRSGQTASAAQLAAANRLSNSTFIEYALGSDHSYVWIIEKGKIESHSLPGRDRILFLVREWKALATVRNSRSGEDFETHQARIEQADRRLPSVGAKLSCLLIEPFVKSASGSLVIVPDGELYQMPFAALPENGCEGGTEPLIAQRQILITPSLSVLLAPKRVINDRPSRGDVLLFADPVFDRKDSRIHRTAPEPEAKSELSLEPALPRLIGTRDEAKAIAALAGPGRSNLYLNFNASLQNLLDPSSRAYRILHLASHGVLDEGMPSSSGIVLSLFRPDGQPVFGYLKAHDITRLDLAYDLVVLSSCDSAAGVNLSGEGVEGLSQAFLSAGSQRVISTLWSVDDEASKKFMISFYTGMLREGLDPAAALRKSEIDMMRNRGTKAPYYWAAFNLTSIIN